MGAVRIIKEIKKKKERERGVGTESEKENATGEREGKCDVSGSLDVAGPGTVQDYLGQSLGISQILLPNR